MTYLLILHLITGETGPVYVDRELCSQIAESVEGGAIAEVELIDGRHVWVVKAECVGPVESAEALTQ